MEVVRAQGALTPAKLENGQLNSSLMSDEVASFVKRAQGSLLQSERMVGLHDHPTMFPKSNEDTRSNSDKVWVPLRVVHPANGHHVESTLGCLPMVHSILQTNPALCSPLASHKDVVLDGHTSRALDPPCLRDDSSLFDIWFMAWKVYLTLQGSPCLAVAHALARGSLARHWRMWEQAVASRTSLDSLRPIALNERYYAPLSAYGKVDTAQV